MKQIKKPLETFQQFDTLTDLPPRVFFAAHRYIQGPGELGRLGYYLGFIGSIKPGVLIPSDLPKSIGETVSAGLVQHEVFFRAFSGECCYAAVATHVEAWSKERVDSVIVVGGGKAIDTAKCVASRLGVPLVVCPTLASSDAPCSAAAVVYTEAGEFEVVEYFPSNPDVVVMDTQVVVNAPARFFTAGIADALATGYEAKATSTNQRGRSMLGARVTLAAQVLSAQCSATIHELAERATNDVRERKLTPAVEDVIEANTLLSGTGFESGGLAGAHGVATALTSIHAVEKKFLHGEMVAVGLLTQLMLENDQQEFIKVKTLLSKLGLPTSFRALGIDWEMESIDSLVNIALGLPFLHNMPFEVNAQNLRAAIEQVDAVA